MTMFANTSRKISLLMKKLSANIGGCHIIPSKGYSALQHSHENLADVASQFKQTGKAGNRNMRNQTIALGVY